MTSNTNNLTETQLREQFSNVGTRASIRTRFHGPTNHKGSRITVTDDGPFGRSPRRLTVECHHALDSQANHARAAQLWLDKHNPGNVVVRGPGLAFDHDYYWTWGPAQDR